MKIDKYFFKIKKDEQGKYSDEGITLNATAAGRYTDETIRRAKILKAKNEGPNPDPNNQKYSDEFYLAYAKSLQLQDILGALNEIHSNRLANFEIKDKDWAGYSYEEIIEMENQGFTIPEEVLLWAHAQQQADVTDYIIVSENTNTDDSATTNAVDGNDELQNLQKTARENIIKAEKAEKAAQTKETEFKTKAEEANRIKARKKTFKDQSIDKIESMAKDWKELDDKKKNGKLNFSEKIKYASLSKKLSGKDNEEGTIIKGLETENAVLNDFLTSLDELQDDITENHEIASDVIKSGRDLSEFEKNYTQESLPFVNKGIVNNGMGLDSDELYGATQNNIADIAIETGKDLEVTTNNINTDIKSDKNTELAAFAQDYATRAEEALSNTKEIMNGNEEEKTNEDNKDKKEEGKLKSYRVDMEFSHKNAKKAAETTIKSTANLVTHHDDVSKDQKTLQKELKKNSKDIKDINKNSKITEQKHNKNLQKEEQLITKLETAQGKTAQGTLEQKVDNAIKAEDKITKQKEEQGEIPAEASKVAPKDVSQDSQEAETTLKEIKSVDEDDKKLKTDLNKTISKGMKSDSVSQKAENGLRKNNSELKTRNDNAQQVTSDTLIVGVGTYAKSFVTTATGEMTYNFGTSLLPNVTTHAAGIALQATGNYLKNEGQKENKNGIKATETGAIGIAISAVASIINSDATRTSKDANKTFQNNKKIFKEAAKSAGEDNNITIQNQSQSTNSTEQTPPIQQEEENQTSITTIDELNTTTENATENTTEIDNSTENTTPENDTQVVETNTTSTTEQTTQENKNTENTQQAPADEQTSPENDNTQKTNKTKQKEDNTYSVSTAFTASNASKAAQTTDQATTALSAYNSRINGLENSVNSQVKKSQNIIKDIQKETTQAIAQHQNNFKLAEYIKENFANAIAQMNNVQTSDETTTIETNMATMSDEFTAISTQDQETTDSANKTIAKNSIQLDSYKTNVKTLNSEISEFDKLIANQLNVSQKTVGVGIGTTAFGTLHSIQGSNKIAEGTILMSNPFTHTLGVIETVIGSLTLAQGTSEISTGTIATVTGANGISINQNAREASEEADNTSQNAQNEYKQQDKQIQEIQKKLQPEQATTEELKTDETKTNVQQNKTEEEIIVQEEPEQTELTTTIAASASANANVNDKTTTDDKADRKLSRFNMDSMIESKKKRKRIQAVSASARNGK